MSGTPSSLDPAIELAIQTRVDEALGAQRDRLFQFTTFGVPILLALVGLVAGALSWSVSTMIAASKEATGAMLAAAATSAQEQSRLAAQKAANEYFQSQDFIKKQVDRMQSALDAVVDATATAQNSKNQVARAKADLAELQGVIDKAPSAFELLRRVEKTASDVAGTKEMQEAVKDAVKPYIDRILAEQLKVLFLPLGEKCPAGYNYDGEIGVDLALVPSYSINKITFLDKEPHLYAGNNTQWGLIKLRICGHG